MNRQSSFRSSKRLAKLACKLSFRLETHCNLLFVTFHLKYNVISLVV